MRYRIIDTVEHHVEAPCEAEAERRFLRGESDCVGVISRAVIAISDQYCDSTPRHTVEDK